MKEILAVWVGFEGELGGEMGRGGAKNYGVGLAPTVRSKQTKFGIHS